jgi:hypothetical protein
MPEFDFTDRTAQFAADELSLGDNLIDGSGNGNFLDDSLGVPTGIAGHVSGGSRGLLFSADRSFVRSTGPAAPWDLRVTGTPGGLVSYTWTGWVWLNNAEQGSFFSIHDPVLASGQAVLINPRETNSGGTPSPWIAMADGITPFNFRAVKPDAVNTFPLMTWQFVAGGWDKVRNKVFGFWGRSPGNFSYGETDGFAAGFNYTVNAANVKLGFFNGEPGQAQMYIEHMLYWKDRALTQAELELIWANHVGIDFNALSGVAGDDAAKAAANYYYGRP